MDNPGVELPALRGAGSQEQAGPGLPTQLQRFAVVLLGQWFQTFGFPHEHSKGSIP